LLDKVDCPRQDAIHMPAALFHADYCQDTLLPFILIIYLSNGNIKIILQPGLEAMQNHPLAL